MQYPIIDNLINAYQRNGWTGLNIIMQQGSLSSSDGSEIDSGTRIRSNFLPLSKIYYNNIGDAVPLSLRFYDEHEVYVNVSAPDHYIIEDNKLIVIDPPQEAKFIRILFRFSDNSNITPSDVLITADADFYLITSNKLKLPMIHYFPHPVIDALQRAAAGTQTADDTEILRHYLTPLGIGGI